MAPTINEHIREGVSGGGGGEGSGSFSVRQRHSTSLLSSTSSSLSTSSSSSSSSASSALVIQKWIFMILCITFFYLDVTNITKITKVGSSGNGSLIISVNVTSKPKKKKKKNAVMMMMRSSSSNSSTTSMAVMDDDRGDQLEEEEEKEEERVPWSSSLDNDNKDQKKNIMSSTSSSRSRSTKSNEEYYDPSSFYVDHDHDLTGISLEPMDVLHQYIKWHSVDSLLAATAASQLQDDDHDDDDDHHHHRKYSIGYYSCPLQAGNRLHHFFNSLLWSIITNRTILWKFYDVTTCQRIGSMYDGKHCQANNTIEACDNILERSSWIPSYDEWKDRLNIKNKDIIDLNFWTTHPSAIVTLSREDAFANKDDFTPFHWIGSKKNPFSKNNSSMKRYIGIDEHPKNGGSTFHTSKIVNFPIMLDKYNDLNNKTHREELLLTEYGRETARKLYSYGSDFLYGMFFRHTFTMKIHSNNNNNKDNEMIESDDNGSDDRINETNGDNVVLVNGVGGIGSNTNANNNVNVHHAAVIPGDPLAFSIAIHSRHMYDDEIGDDITKETNCLIQILQKRRQQQGGQQKDVVNKQHRSLLASLLLPSSLSSSSTTKQQEQEQAQQPCHVYLMSDRTITIERLSSWLWTEHGCYTFTANHTKGNSFLDEHGPYAGIGFFQDLEVVTKYSKHAFIGGLRSSSSLIIEIMVYDHIINDAIVQQQQQQLLMDDEAAVAILSKKMMDINDDENNNNTKKRIITIPTSAISTTTAIEQCIIVGETPTEHKNQMKIIQQQKQKQKQKHDNNNK